MKKNKAQIGMEFIMVVSALLFFVAIFFSMIQENASKKIYEREALIVKEIATTIQKEINLAKKSSDGYSREFKIPLKAGNLNYEVSILQNFIMISTTNGKHALSLPTENINGQINITDNKIRKINGEIYLNQ